MAEFCEICAKHMDFEPDFNIEEEFNLIQKNEMTKNFLCEGCGLLAIAKDEQEKKLYYYFDDTEWQTIRRI